MKKKIDIRDVFSKDAHDILSQYPELADKVVFAIPLLQNKAAGEAIDTIVDTDGKLRVRPHPLSTDADVFCALADTTVPGNVILMGAPLTIGVYEIHAFIYIYKCSADVAARTTAAPHLTGLYTAGIGSPAPTVSLDFYAGSTLSLAASQDGFVCLEPGGVEVKNQNNTVTYGTSKLMLPITARVITNTTPAISGTAAAATNGVVADFHRIIIWGRRLA